MVGPDRARVGLRVGPRRPRAEVTPPARSRAIRVVSLALAVGAGFTLAPPAPASAGPSPAAIAVLAPGPDPRDARGAVVVGPSGEVYEPDGSGAWLRRHAGGVADKVVRATRARGLVIAGVDAGPAYAFRAGTAPARGDGDAIGAWNMVVLGWHAKAIVGRGPRATAAVGKRVFALDTGTPVRLPDAPDPVVLLAASSRGVVAATDKGLVRLVGTTWKPIPHAPAQVLAVLDDRWVLVDRGLVDLRSRRVIPWPADFQPAAAIAVDSQLVVAAGTHGAAAELVTVSRGKPVREPIGGLTPAGAAGIVSVVADRAGRVVVATRDGQLAIRDHTGAWAAGRLRDARPAEHPGPPPAESK